MKYTWEVLEPIVKASDSIAEVLRRLGLKGMGGTHTHLSRRIKQLGIDTSHMAGIRANRGVRHKGGNTKKLWQDVLIERHDGKREKRFRLLRALLESGLDYRCNSCTGGPTWNNKPLVLQINHKNGRIDDDRRENLEFLCPNCHSQTDTYGAVKNNGSVVEQVDTADLESAVR